MVLGHPPGDPAGPLHRLQRRAVALLARVVGDVADDHGGGHALAAVLGGVEGAVEAVHARLVEHQGGRLVGPDPLGRPPAAVDGHGVVRRPALVGEPDRGPGRHPGDLPGEEVVVHGHVDRAPRRLPARAAGQRRPGQGQRHQQAPTPGAGHGASSDAAGRRYLAVPPPPPASAIPAARYAAGVRKLVKTSIRLADGRELLYYDEREGIDRRVPDTRDLAAAVTSSQIRCDPLLEEWVIVASHRQGRTHLPPADQCPLCPSSDGRATEIPAADYDVVVFENRFPSLASDRPGPPAAPGPGAGAVPPPAGRWPLRGRLLHLRPRGGAGPAAGGAHPHGGRGLGRPDPGAGRAGGGGAGVPVREPGRGDRGHPAPPPRADLRLPVRGPADRPAAGRGPRPPRRHRRLPLLLDRGGRGGRPSG